MAFSDVLRKTGIFRSGSTSATYTNAKDRPTELLMDDVYNAKKDLVYSNVENSTDGKSEPTPQSPPPTTPAPTTQTPPPPPAPPSSPPPPTPPPSSPTPPPSPSSSAKDEKNTIAIVGLIFAFFVPIVGLIMSIIGLSKSKKTKGVGKGLAIAGIIVSIFVGFLQLLFFTGIIVAVIFGTNLSLTQYSDPTRNYTVKHPEEWEKVTETVQGAESVAFEDKLDETGKVTGRVEVVYVPPPATGYKEEVLQIFKDELKKQNPGTVIEFESASTYKGNESLRMITTYDGEVGRIKAKTTIIRLKDNVIYVVSTQCPIENYEKYSDTFDEIHSTFTP